MHTPQLIVVISPLAFRSWQFLDWYDIIFKLTFCRLWLFDSSHLILFLKKWHSLYMLYRVLEIFQVSCFAIVAACFSGPTPPLPQHETLRHFLPGSYNATHSLTLNTSEKCVSTKKVTAHMCVHKSNFIKKKQWILDVDTLQICWCKVLVKYWNIICFMFSFLETVPAHNGSASRNLKIKYPK